MLAVNEKYEYSQKCVVIRASGDVAGAARDQQRLKDRGALVT